MAINNVIPKISISQTAWQPATFQPFVYTPKRYDPTLFKQSIEKLEQREQNARTSRQSVDSSLTTFRSQLEEEDKEWLSKKTNEIQAQLDTHINAGNYATALRLAQEAANNLTRDTELQDRLASSTEYRNYIKKLNDRSDISQATKERFKEQSKYSFQGSAGWTPSQTPVSETITIAQLVGLAEQRTMEKRGNTTINGIPYKPGYKNNNSNSNNVHTSSHYVFNKKDVEEMQKTLYELLKDPQYRTSLQQQYETNIWAYNNAKKRYNAATTQEEKDKALADMNTYKASATDKDGFIRNITDFDTWIVDQTKGQFEQLSYNHISTSNTYSQIKSDDVKLTPEQQQRYLTQPFSVGKAGTGQGTSTNSNNLKSPEALNNVCNQ